MAIVDRLNNTVVPPNQNMLFLDTQYGVVADGVTDNSTAVASAIAKASSIGSNVTLVFPPGRILATKLATTITGANIWLAAAGGPGTSVLVLGQDIGLTWATTYGGTYNMGFDYSGTNAANVTILDHGSADSFHINPFIGSGIGTFFKMDNFGLSGQTLIDGAFGGGNNNANTPLFNVLAGAGFVLRNSTLNQNGGTAASGRVVISAGTGGQFDTLIVQNNFVQLYDGFAALTAANGVISGNIFFQGNVADGNVTSAFTFNALSGGEFVNIYIEDPWITALNGPAISFSGAGDFNNIRITGRIVASGTHGIIATSTGNFFNFNMTGVNGSSLNLLGNGSAAGVSLLGGTGYKNITISGCQLGMLDEGSTKQPVTGCLINGIIDRLVFTNNNFQGSTANYDGMLTGSGTTHTYAHTNTKQRANIGLIDAPAYAAAEVELAAGAWTPVLKGASTAGSPTYTTQEGSFIQIGNQITAWFNISISAKTSISGNLQIDGLPTASTNTSNDLGIVTIAEMSGITLTANYVSIAGVTLGGTTKVGLVQNGSAQTVAALTDTNLGSTATLIGMVVYHI